MLMSAAAAFAISASFGATPGIRIEPGHVGGLTAMTRPTTEAIRDAFPGARVEPFATEGIGGFQNGGRGWNVWVGRELALVVLSGDRERITSANVLGRSASTPDGVRVGSGIGEVLAAGRVSCKRVPAEERPLLSCARSAAPNVGFVFEPSDRELALVPDSGELLAADLRRLDRSHRISMIVWAPAPEARAVVLSAMDVRLLEAALPEFRKRGLKLDEYTVEIRESLETVVTFRQIEPLAGGARLDLWVKVNPVTLQVIDAAYNK